MAFGTPFFRPSRNLAGSNKEFSFKRITYLEHLLSIKNFISFVPSGRIDYLVVLASGYELKTTEAMMENIKEIPYGIANFVEVAEQNMYYVDKTMYLPLLEKQPRNLFFIRPRRFGKSIF